MSASAPAYSPEDAARDLRPVLDRAPPGAVSGRWTATTMQAAHSTRTGGYRDRDGGVVRQDRPEQLDALEPVVDRLEAASPTRINHVTVSWTRARFPWQRNRIVVETRFDPAIVPRGPDHPAYGQAARARHAFWSALGDVARDYAAEREAANAHNQTKWFGPHRRILKVACPDRTILATDGLSTPWAGIVEPENGVECEVVLEFSGHDLGPAQVALWADMLIGVGDLVADGYRVARDVKAHGALVFCGLPQDCAPWRHMLLSPYGASIDGLPFGTVPLLRATPVTAAELADRDPDEPWGATAAREALRRRGIAA
ncbi:hypothetical protein [Zavarzinia sp. CC-PAN008]|uniref:hypothetical protein n=1 Tax=Zavarzinia sp. CC-PAN008 TaxID=3243332 RepID=UPI003F74760D